MSTHDQAVVQIHHLWVAKNDFVKLADDRFEAVLALWSAFVNHRPCDSISRRA